MSRATLHLPPLLGYALTAADTQAGCLELGAGTEMLHARFPTRGTHSKEGYMFLPGSREMY
eukprot:16002101-Heterocapsa_arctica.AAC.1